jgi:hypothetical protein
VNCNIVSLAALLIRLFNKIPEGRTCSKASRCGWGASPPSTSRPALPPTRVNGDVAAVSRRCGGVAAVSSAQVSLPLCLGALTLPVHGQTQEPSAWPIPQCIVANYPARQRVPCPLCGRPPPRASGLAPPHDLLPPPGRSAP